MASLPIPEVEEIEAIYGLEGAVEATSRYQRLAAAFKEKYGQAPEIYARAPGRVNLIGEHIDYEGYGVLPMAIRQDTIVAIRRGGDKLVVANLEAEQYPEIEFGTDPAQALDVAKHTWANYFLSAYKGVFEHLQSKGIAAPSPVGLQVMVHGTVPLGSGLSSSAAIVCSSSLAIAAVLGVAGSLTKGDVSEFTCTAERHVGVTSGGMDQAISVMGMPGVAMLVEFNPVRATDVQLPAGSTFVIANSMAVSKKAETADRRYNLRVVECRLAAMMLAVALGKPPGEAAAVTTLKQVEPAIIDKYGPGAEAQDKAVRELLHEGVYMPEEVEGLLQRPLASIYEGNASALRVLGVVGPEGFRLRDRALHVYSEAGRVYGFRDVCKSDAAAEDKLSQLGSLMDASHASCAGLYECSCAELDALVGAARAAGALGARLTGAGWGGCTVSLVREADAPKFIAALREQYYAPLVAQGVVKEKDLGECLFASKPSSGAALMKLKLASHEQPAEAPTQPAAAPAEQEAVMYEI
uniref:Galactokinase n=1 Tax=Tetradesmus obliquus TaxID=3088 RepID=A0A383V891_TETOB|eukprot:jgi/Sobl393_1/12620/SZX60794.1